MSRRTKAAGPEGNAQETATSLEAGTDVTRETFSRFRVPPSYLETCGLSGTRRSAQETAALEAGAYKCIKRNTTSEFRVPASYQNTCGISGTRRSEDGGAWICRTTESEFRVPIGYMANWCHGRQIPEQAHSPTTWSIKYDVWYCLYVHLVTGQTLCA